MTDDHVVAVVLAAVGAVLFGLSTVRQHGAVQEVITSHLSLRELRGLLRQPSWLLGAGQGILGAALHAAALVLAPITLVQPVGVVAVPVTVVAHAWQTRQRPTRAQVVGSALSVLGIVVLTVLLLAPEVHPPTPPPWPVVAGTVLVLVLATVLLILVRGVGPPLLRCMALASAAAVLFGLNSILLRTIGQVVRSGRAGPVGPLGPPHHPGPGGPVGFPWALLVVALVGLCVALPVGVWATQTAYLSGSPHVVICCLTLVDPISAVIGGHLLLHDDVAVRGWVVVAAVGCALVAAVGVLLLSLDDPVDEPAEVAGR